MTHEKIKEMKKKATLYFLLALLIAIPYTTQAQIQLGLDIDGEAVGNPLGWSVSLSSDGSRVAIGATSFYEWSFSSGYVRIYEWGGNTWTQLGMDIDGEAAEDNSGWSVSLSSDGSRVAIGAPSNDGNGDYSGHVRIYEWGGNTWTQLGMDIDEAPAGDQSGGSVSLSSDGSRVAIGTSFYGPLAITGYARVYDLSDLDFLTHRAATDIELFPNPTGGELTLKNLDPGRVEVYDNTNRLMLSLDQPGSTFDLSALSSGMYFLKIYAGEKMYLAKVVKE